MTESFSKLSPATDAYVEWVEEEAVVLDQETGVIHYLNPSAALLYALILEQGVDSAIKELEKRHLESADQREEVAEFLGQLVEVGLLVRNDD